MTYFEQEEWEDRVARFADPGGTSALWAADQDNPRDQPCGNCGWPRRLTRRDVQNGYCCDSCASAMETGRDIDYYEETEEA